MGRNYTAHGRGHKSNNSLFMVIDGPENLASFHPIIQGPTRTSIHTLAAANTVSLIQRKTALSTYQLTSMFHIESENIRPFNFGTGGNTTATGNTLIMIPDNNGMICNQRN